MNLSFQFLYFFLFSYIYSSFSNDVSTTDSNDVDIISSPNYEEINLIRPLNFYIPDKDINNGINKETKNLNRLVNLPFLIRSNDTSIDFGFQYDVSHFGKSLSNIFIVELSKGLINDDFVEIKRIYPENETNLEKRNRLKKMKTKKNEDDDSYTSPFLPEPYDTNEDKEFFNTAFYDNNYDLYDNEIISLTSTLFSSDQDSSSKHSKKSSPNNSIRTVISSITGLNPLTSYRLRIVPLTTNEFARASEILTFSTLNSPNNYWEGILTKRVDKLTKRGGYNDPNVLKYIFSSTNKTENSKIIGNNNENLFFSGYNNYYLPSGRRGHTSTLIDSTIFMFGGRSNGYSCAFSIKDTINLGINNSGRFIKTCSYLTNESNELWKFNLALYQWENVKYNGETNILVEDNDILNNNIDFNNSTDLNLPFEFYPGRREQHNAISYQNYLYIFGGKASIQFGEDSDSLPSKKYYNDLWRINMNRAKQINFFYNDNNNLLNQNILIDPNSAPITDYSTDYRVFSNKKNFIGHINPFAYEDKLNYFRESYFNFDNNIKNYFNTTNLSPRFSDKILNITVSVTFSHPCLSQVQINLRGPGPLNPSPNYYPNVQADSSSFLEIPLITRFSTGSGECVGGKFTILFNDNFQSNSLSYDYDKLNNINLNNKELIDDGEELNHYFLKFKPSASLNNFYDFSIFSNQWSIILSDNTNDILDGVFYNWNIKFNFNKKFESSTWELVHPGNTFTVTNSDMNLSYDNYDQIPNNIFSFSSVYPSKRYGAISILHEDSFYIYGGYNENNKNLNDLYRFSLTKNLWHELTPVGFDSYSFSPTSATGYSLSLTPWGLARFGGYSRYPHNINMLKKDSNLNFYSNDKRASYFFDSIIYILDPVTMRWQNITITSLKNEDNASNIKNFISTKKLFSVQPSVSVLGEQPPPRYLSSFVYVPKDAVKFHSPTSFINENIKSKLYNSNDLLEEIEKNKINQIQLESFLYNYNLFSTNLTSTNYNDLIQKNYLLNFNQTNFKSIIINSFFVYGGFNNQISSNNDGSSGGYLNDVWFFRAGALSSFRSIELQEEWKNRFCFWRKSKGQMTSDCKKEPEPNTILDTKYKCKFRELLMLAWCSGETQSFR